MPICEADPWRLQYFEHAACPPGVNIPTEDADAWLWNPRHRWVYDKIAIARSQGLEAGPHGTPPPSFPVFSKPITNLKGMGIDSRVIRSAAEYEASMVAGHMWMTLLRGRHVSSDAVVVDGAPCWWRHVSGAPAGNGTFDHWTVHAAPDRAIEDYCSAWIRAHLQGYTGLVNIETIGGRIIEVHLRMSDQWPDLYGSGWVDALIALYHYGRWRFRETEQRDGYSVVLFGPHGRRYRHPPAALVDGIRRMADVSSIQITFHEDWEPERHAMPPGGFRLAIVNTWAPASGFTARELLRRHFLLRAA